jgi:glutathionylspermidine synthase
MKLIPIPEDKYDDYRLNLMFDCYKWDPQFLDHNTVAKHALVLSKEEYEELKRLTEAMDKETRAAEDFLNEHLEYAEPLRLSKKIRKEIESMKNYDPNKHVRLMRYDFHPTVDGTWAVSEVNSDVPGGFAEGSLWAPAAIEAIGDTNYSYIDFGEIMVNAISEKVRPGGRIMMVHCTCYSDDRQVMQFLGDRLQERGFEVMQGAADHVRFKDNKAYSILDGHEGDLDAIIRFNPLEWVKDIKPKHWAGYFNTETCSCNHPIALFAQTKLFPMVWDALEENGISMATWRSLLPETLEVKDAKGREGFIYKPVYGRVGEFIGIKEACTEQEYKQIMKEVKWSPKSYLAQKKFISKPLIGADGKEYHVCIGSYTINGKHAGFYARVNDAPRIDSNAADIPVLIEGGVDND